ncbi:hypothetical protein Tco_0993903, partial [Tanacetum coccineum]
KPEDSTNKPDEGTDKPKVSTNKEEVSTDKPDEGTVDQNEGRKKGVELKDVEETERPRPTSTRSLLTLKPIPKIDPKDKCKKMIEEEDESDTDSEDITEAKKKFKQLARDEEVAGKHVGGKKHSDLKTKGFEEIKALYDKIKMSDDSFIAIGSAEDEKVSKEMNEQVVDA